MQIKPYNIEIPAMQTGTLMLPLKSLYSVIDAVMVGFASLYLQLFLHLAVLLRNCLVLFKLAQFIFYICKVLNPAFQCNCLFCISRKIIA